jgi:hypothetical protein
MNERAKAGSPCEIAFKTDGQRKIAGKIRVPTGTENINDIKKQAN